jgi:hypothetical protein
MNLDGAAPGMTRREAVGNFRKTGLSMSKTTMSGGNSATVHARPVAV